MQADDYVHCQTIICKLRPNVLTGSANENLQMCFMNDKFKVSRIDTAFHFLCFLLVLNLHLFFLPCSKKLLTRPIM